MLTVKNQNSYYYGKPTTSSLQAIKRIDDLVSKTEKEISNLQYQLDVFNKELMRVYKSNIDYIMLEPFLKGAQTWIGALKNGTLNGEKIDRRKRYNEKDSYEMLKQQMEKFLGCKIEITNIITYAYNTEAYIVTFVYNGKTFELYIPVIKNVTLDSVKYSGAQYCFAMHVSIEESPGCYSGLFYTYEEEELKNLFEKSLKELEEKSDH